MTTRSGATYKPSMMEEERIEGNAVGERTAQGVGSDMVSAPLNDLVRMLMEDHRQRDQELEDECRQWDLEAIRHEKELLEQMEMIKWLVETSGARAGDAMITEDDGGGSGERGKMVLTKYTEGDDMEAYLTTFEHLMTVH